MNKIGSYYNLCGIFQKEKKGGGVHIKITGMQDSNIQGRQK
jgi:hypothetical protein